MPQQTARSLMKDFRNSFRRKKVQDTTPKVEPVKEVENVEQTRLQELKNHMGDNLPTVYTDQELVGFLKARSLNVEEAEKLVKLDENIRKILRVEEYEPPSDLSFYDFTGLIGFDKEGSLVRVINVGGCDCKGLMHRISTIELFKVLIRKFNQDIAVQLKENKKTGGTSIYMVFIMNLEGFSMSQISCKPAFDTMFQSLKLLQDHYHEAIKKLYFINAPTFFSSAYKLFKPVIQDSLQEKVNILEYGNWKEELLKVIDADVLPSYLGGNRVDSNGDANCSEFVGFGMPVPEDLYASNFLDENDPEVTAVNIPAGGTQNFRFPVRQAGSVLRWHIQSKDNDLAIGVYMEPFQSGTETPRTRKKRDEDMSKFEPLTPIIRSQCHIAPEEGGTVIWKAGNIIIHLDNSYSWMNSKDVLFKISVTPPTDNEKNTINSTNQVAKNFGKMTLSK